MATFKKRGDGWYVQVRRKGYPAQYKTFRTKAEGESWARAQEGRMDRGDAPLDLKVLRASTFGELVSRYLREETPKKRGAASEALRINKMLRAPLCDLSLAELSASAIASYRDLRLREAAPGTVRRELYLFRRVVNVARREWDVPIVENPFERITNPIVRDARDRRLGRGELAKLETALGATRNKLIRPAMLLAIETAMRRGELLALAWADVDEEKRIARIHVTKNGHPRSIPLTDGALKILSELPRKEAQVLPLSSYSLRLAWERTVARAGLDDLRWHDLRHEAVSRFAEMGLSMAELAIISGHRDLRMLSRYTHLRPADLAAKLSGRSWANEIP